MCRLHVFVLATVVLVSGIGEALADLTTTVNADATGGFGDVNIGWQDMVAGYVFSAGGESVDITVTGQINLYDGYPTDALGVDYPRGSSGYSPLQEGLVDAGTNPSTLGEYMPNLGGLTGAFIPQSTASLPTFQARDEDLVTTGYTGIASDALFLIGTELNDYTATTAGTLYLGINDTIAGNNSGSFDVLFTPVSSAVPEPCSLILCSLGAAGMACGAARRRRKKQAV